MAALVVLLAVGLIGGGLLLLSGDDDGDEDLARTSDTSEATDDSDDSTARTTEPDERQTTTTRPPPPTTEPPPEVDLDDLDLEEGLLTEADLAGLGISFTEYDPDATSDSDRGEYSAGPECDAMVAVFEQTEAFDGAVRSFTDESYFSVHHYVEQVGQGLPGVSEVEEATLDCPSLERIGGDLDVVLTQEIVPTARRGDTVIASVVTAQYEDGYESTSFQIEWERDGVQTLLSLWEADPILLDLDRQALTEDLADVVDGRLDDLLSG